MKEQGGSALQQLASGISHAERGQRLPSLPTPPPYLGETDENEELFRVAGLIFSPPVSTTCLPEPLGSAKYTKTRVVFNASEMVSAQSYIRGSDSTLVGQGKAHRPDPAIVIVTVLCLSTRVAY